MRIHPLDLAIVIAYLLGVTAFGIHFRRGQKDARDYFLGGRTAPWWALAFSIVATETSTLTIIGTPAISYGEILPFSNWSLATSSAASSSSCCFFQVIFAANS